MRAKMNTKKILVSLCTIVTALFLVATVSAACDGLSSECACTGTLITSPSTPDIASCLTIEVDGTNVLSNPSFIAGDEVTVKVTFTAGDLHVTPEDITASTDGNASTNPVIDGSATDVRVKVNIEGDKDSVDALSDSFDVIAGHTYTRTLKLQIPFELKDDKSAEVTLSVKIWNGDYKSESEDIALLVQRPSYNPVVKSISTSQSVDAGETFPVDIVLKNVGYNDLNDVYVTVGIPTLGIQKTAYFGDLVAQESCTGDCKEVDTVSGRIFLEVPYTAKAGVYTLEVKVENDDVEATFARQIAVENNLPENVIVTTTSKTVAVGENAEYTLLLVNPTDSLVVYEVIAESSGEVSSSVDSAVVAVPAGSSKTVTVTAKAKTEGDYTFDVSVLSNKNLVEKVTLNLKAEGKAVNPIVVLTVVLAIIFLVLLVVLIVLIGRKPQKSEEYGESYY
jgi:hypothetical protein